MPSNAGMNDDALIRRENLHRLCKARGLGATQLSAALGGRYTYWRDLLSDSQKSFGEKIARRIEEGLELPRGWLDQQLTVPHSADPKLTAREPKGAQYVAVPTWWLFTPELFLRARQCDAVTLTRLENTLRMQLDMPAVEPGKANQAAA